MKKYIMTLVIALGLGMSVSAQGDGFFAYTSQEYRADAQPWSGDYQPFLPQHGYDFHSDADPTPIGSGLLLLAGMGLAYGIRKRQSK